MKLIFLSCLLFISSCATKYTIPGNRFITPETQGDAFHGQIEFQQSSANRLTGNLTNGSADDGVIYTDVSRSGFLFSNSFFDRFDLLWSHTGGANSMIGGKLQIMGESRIRKSQGNKVSIAVLFGGNEHETDDASVEFELTGREYLLMYGYRITENLLPYASISYASYNFEGRLVSSGQTLDYITNSRSANGGIEFSFNAFFAKVEATYQQLLTSDTKDKTRIGLGYSLGFQW